MIQSSKLLGCVREATMVCQESLESVPENFIVFQSSVESVSKSFFLFFDFFEWLTLREASLTKWEKQAGAELCQAQES